MTSTSTTTRTWYVDRSRSTVDFTARGFWGLMPVKGQFDRYDGSYTTDGDSRSIKLHVDADSLDTGVEKRDHHLRSEDFFDAEKHPTVRFVSSSVSELGDGKLHVVGELEAGGTSVPLDFVADERRFADELEIEATTPVDLEQFRMSRGALNMVHPKATLHVKARLVAA